MIRACSLAFVAAACLALAAPEAGAQPARNHDVTGCWSGVDARLELGGSAGHLQVTLTTPDRIRTGEGRFDGRRLVATLRAPLGIADRLEGDAHAAPETLVLVHGIDGKSEVLRGAAGTFRRPLREEEWGGRAEIAATMGLLFDALGNKDGIIGNENEPANSTAGGLFGWVKRQPLLFKMAAFLAPGLTTKTERQVLGDFVAREERAWGRAVTELRPEDMAGYDLFRAEKAIALERFGRTPDEVTEGFVTARGSVHGQAIAPRRIFWQRFQPRGPSSGKRVVISPGFQETGRNFLEQIDLLARRGHEVVVMDHQWAGKSDGSAGGLDRGFGVARDVAAVAAFAAGLEPARDLVLVGNSMGAGPGVLGAAALNDAGLVQLEGAAMPRGVPIVLQAPFLGMTPNLLNRGLAAASRIPLVNRIPVPSLGLPPLTSDRAASEKLAGHAAAEDVRARLRSMTSAVPDLETILAIVKEGRGPLGRVAIIHGDRDPLADPAKSADLARRLGDRARLDSFSSENHVLEESPTEQGRVLAAVDWVANRD